MKEGIEKELQYLLGEYRATGDDSRIANVLEAYDQVLKEKDKKIIEKIEKRLKLVISQKNEIKNDPFHPVRCQYLGQEDALKYVLSLITKQK